MGKERNPWDRLFRELVLVAAAIVIAVFTVTGWWRVILALLTGETTIWAVMITPPVTGILSLQTLEGLGWIFLALIARAGITSFKAVEWEYSRL